MHRTIDAISFYDQWITVPMVGIIARNVEPSKNDCTVDGNCEEQVLPNCTLYYKGKWKYLAVYLENSLRIDLPDVLLFPVISFPFAAHIQGYRRHAWYKRQYNRRGLLLGCPKSAASLITAHIFLISFAKAFINMNFSAKLLGLIYEKLVHSINTKICVVFLK